MLNSDEKTELINEALRRIAETTRETVHYCVLDRDATVLVQRAKGTQLVAVDFQIGDRSPLHCTSIGKLLLAYQDMRRAEEVIGRGLPKMAINTITEAEQFRAELRQIRAQGFAFDDREFHDECDAWQYRSSRRAVSLTGGLVFRGRVRASHSPSSVNLETWRETSLAISRRNSEESVRGQLRLPLVRSLTAARLGMPAHASPREHLTAAAALAKAAASGADMPSATDNA